MISLILLGLMGLNLAFTPARAEVDSSRVGSGVLVTTEESPPISTEADLPLFLDEADSENDGNLPPAHQQELINQAYERGRLTQSPWGHHGEEPLPVAS